jgi:hypothetical protein
MLTEQASTLVELELPLSLEESRLILEALVEKPFKQVFELIGLLNHQAQAFYVNPALDKTTERHKFVLSSVQFHCCVTALGDLPYNRVQPLLAHMHEQLQMQSSKLTGRRND